MDWDLSIPVACFWLIVRKEPVVECLKTTTCNKKWKIPYFGLLVVALKWRLCLIG